VSNRGTPADDYYPQHPEDDLTEEDDAEDDQLEHDYLDEETLEHEEDEDDLEDGEDEEEDYELEEEEYSNEGSPTNNAQRMSSNKDEPICLDSDSDSDSGSDPGAEVSNRPTSQKISDKVEYDSGDEDEKEDESEVDDQSQSDEDIQDSRSDVQDLPDDIHNQIASHSSTPEPGNRCNDEHPDKHFTHSTLDVAHDSEQYHGSLGIEYTHSPAYHVEEHEPLASFANQFENPGGPFFLDDQIVMPPHDIPGISISSPSNTINHNLVTRDGPFSYSVEHILQHQIDPALESQSLEQFHQSSGTESMEKGSPYDPVLVESDEEDTQISNLRLEAGSPYAPIDVEDDDESDEDADEMGENTYFTAESHSYLKKQAFASGTPTTDDSENESEKAKHTHRVRQKDESDNEQGGCSDDDEAEVLTDQEMGDMDGSVDGEGEESYQAVSSSVLDLLDQNKRLSYLLYKKKGSLTFT